MAGRSSYIVFVLALVLAGVFGAARAWAMGEKPRAGETITQYLTPAILQSLFPGADRIGDVAARLPPPPFTRPTGRSGTSSRPGT